MIELAFMAIWLLAGACLWHKCGTFYYEPENDGFWDRFWAGFLHVMVPFACIIAWPFLAIISVVAGGTIEYNDEDGWSTYTEEDEDD